jgi:hypothetical protein
VFSEDGVHVRIVASKIEAMHTTIVIRQIDGKVIWPRYLEITDGYCSRLFTSEEIHMADSVNRFREVLWRV